MELPQIPSRTPPEIKLTKRGIQISSPKPKAITVHGLKVENKNIKFSPRQP
jgi:hypothetical protein